MTDPFERPAHPYLNRRNFILAAAAAIVPTVPVRDLWAAALPEDKWFVGFDPAGEDPSRTLFFRRTPDGIMWLEHDTDLTTADEIHARWREAYPEIATWWGTADV